MSAGVRLVRDTQSGACTALTPAHPTTARCRHLDLELAVVARPFWIIRAAVSGVAEATHVKTPGTSPHDRLEISLMIHGGTYSIDLKWIMDRELRTFRSRSAMSASTAARSPERLAAVTTACSPMNSDPTSGALPTNVGRQSGFASDLRTIPSHTRAIAPHHVGQKAQLERRAGDAARRKTGIPSQVQDRESGRVAAVQTRRGDGCSGAIGLGVADAIGLGTR
jgi:hypothetical protein